MDRLHAFGQVLRTLRKSRGLTQEDLAGIIERAVQSVSNMERGENEPTLDTLIRISEGLKVPLRELTDVFDPNEPGDPERLTLQTSLIETARRLSLRDLKIVTEIAKAFPEQS